MNTDWAGRSARMWHWAKRLWWITTGAFCAWLGAKMDHDVDSALAVALIDLVGVLLFLALALWSGYKRVRQVIDETRARGGK